MFTEFINSIKNVVSTLVLEGMKTIGVFGTTNTGTTAVGLSIIKSMMDKMNVSDKKPSLMVVSYEKNTSCLIDIMTEIGYDFKTIVFCHVFHQLSHVSYHNCDYVFFDMVDRNSLSACLNEFHKSDNSATVVFSEALHRVRYGNPCEDETINQINVSMKSHAIGRRDTATAIMVSRSENTAVMKQLHGFSNTAKRVVTLN